MSGVVACGPPLYMVRCGGGKVTVEAEYGYLEVSIQRMSRGFRVPGCPNNRSLNRRRSGVATAREWKVVQTLVSDMFATGRKQIGQRRCH